MKKINLKSFIKLVGFYLSLIIATVLVVVLIRVFVFASFAIPSDSMSPTIINGDKILVNKLIFGARILTSLNIKEEIKTKRVKGIRPVKRDEVIVFNFPHKNSWDKIEMNINQHYVKRCVAISGDTFRIENGFYKVAGVSDTLGIYANQEKISKMSDDELKERQGIFDAFPFDSINYNWNIKNFGPLYIPKKGDNLVIDTVNCILYKKLIEGETKKMISVKNNIIFLDNEEIKNYTFDNNYYFLTGDFNLDSQDSRYWGMLPEFCIVGVATHIWNSKDPETSELRTDRILRKIK